MSIDLTHTEDSFSPESIDWLCLRVALIDAYTSRYGGFCAHDDNDNDANDTTDYFIPCACARGNNSSSYSRKPWYCPLNTHDLTILCMLSPEWKFWFVYRVNDKNRHKQIIIKFEAKVGVAATKRQESDSDNVVSDVS